MNNILLSKSIKRITVFRKRLLFRTHNVAQGDFHEERQSADTRRRRVLSDASRPLTSTTCTYSNNHAPTARCPEQISIVVCAVQGNAWLFAVRSSCGVRRKNPGIPLDPSLCLPMLSSSFSLPLSF